MSRAVKRSPAVGVALRIRYYLPTPYIKYLCYVQNILISSPSAATSESPSSNQISASPFFSPLQSHDMRFSGLTALATALAVCSVHSSPVKRQAGVLAVWLLEVAFDSMNQPTFPIHKHIQTVNTNGSAKSARRSLKPTSTKNNTTRSPHGRRLWLRT